jgi:ubiquinone/menaquinone biosynthesis C-methylase UbiE
MESSPDNSQGFHAPPVLGGTAPRHAWRTRERLANFALRYLSYTECGPGEQRYLDVGCGNGFITERIAPHFDQVFGIDVEEGRLRNFHDYAGGEPRLKTLLMSAGKMGFPKEAFSFITCFEVLEHVVDLEAAVREIVRVCKCGGIIVISAPQVWFPFENHGVRFGKWTYSGKVPLLPYIRPLHRKCALARVFSSTEMDRLFLTNQLELLATGYAAPQFERAAAQKDSWEGRLVFLRSILNRCETVPVLRAIGGVSLLKAYRKRR